ncbi:MAG: geranylgeranyl reductase family protein [Burkholderiaceae bacterium]
MFDVCIIGAGPAGSTAAYLLTRQGLSVALIDRAHFPRDKTCGDGITPRGARVLARIGALDSVAGTGFACRGVDIRGPGLDGTTVEFTMRFDPGRSGGPSDLIVLPRLALDDLLLKHALAAGPAWFEKTKVVAIETHDTHARVFTDGDLVIDAAAVVLATGAESQLLRACKLLDKKPAVEHAARVYFDDVEGLSDRVVLFFDGVDLPGYGWIFPTSATSANIGCGVFAQDIVESGQARRAMPQAQRLETLLATHPMLKRMLANATRSAPLRAYPLRTDFQRDFAGRDRLMVIGEAAGLVNPITGEGIDYALESAEFLAAAFASGWPKGGAATVDAAKATQITEDYRERLSKRFTRRFSLYRAVQRHALAPERTPALLTQVAKAPALQRLVVDGLFGRAKPAHLLRPRTLWEIARMLTRATNRTTARR